MNGAPVAAIPAPLWLHTATVLPGWIDYNGHMTDGYYAVAFGAATDAVLDYLGLGAAYRARTGCGLYTVEVHVTFERELKAGAPLKFASLVMGADARRLHLFHLLYHAQAGYRAATNEVMLLHVDGQPRACALPAEQSAWAAAVVAAHQAVERPVHLGAHIVPLVKPDSNK
jgi:acyl-CoA thioester hydrolase